MLISYYASPWKDNSSHEQLHEYKFCDLVGFRIIQRAYNPQIQLNIFVCISKYKLTLPELHFGQHQKPEEYSLYVFGSQQVVTERIPTNKAVELYCGIVLSVLACRRIALSKIRLTQCSLSTQIMNHHILVLQHKFMLDQEHRV